MVKGTLLNSFSGGRTSGYMTWVLNSAPFADRIVNVFMNTGLEDERTLTFVNECDKRWGLDLVWLEAVVSPKVGVATTYQRTTYETAHRGVEIFEAVVKKFGIPNAGYPHCNRELKLRPFEKFLKQEHPCAHRSVGIRVDEIDRMSAESEAKRIVYPLVSWLPTTKSAVLDWWRKQPFNLMLPEHRGNCVTCWKKSNRKLYTLARETPEEFRHFAYLETKYGKRGAGLKNSGVFFRKHRSTGHILVEAADTFKTFVDPYFNEIDDTPNGCSESCEVFT